MYIKFMLEMLHLNNFPTAYGLDYKALKGSFILKTCQRTLVLSYKKNPIKNIYTPSKYLNGEDAYSYLLEIICGLQSKLLGESEIVAQFKQAYKQYVSSEMVDTTLLRILEKLFKDAKEIRSQYLIGLSQKTYSSIARKKIVGKHKADQVLILGSGQLAEDLINQFKKKARVLLCARNSDRVEHLVNLHNIETHPWDDFHSTYAYPFIVNTIGTNEKLLKHHYFEKRQSHHDNHLFIDLGSPSIIETHYNLNHGVMLLDDVFNEGAIHETHKKRQIQKAKIAMDEIVIKRANFLGQKRLRDMKKNQVYV